MHRQRRCLRRLALCFACCVLRVSASSRVVVVSRIRVSAYDFRLVVSCVVHGVAFDLRARERFAGGRAWCGRRACDRGRVAVAGCRWRGAGGEVREGEGGGEERGCASASAVRVRGCEDEDGTSPTGQGEAPAGLMSDHPRGGTSAAQCKTEGRRDLQEGDSAPSLRQTTDECPCSCGIPKLDPLSSPLLSSSSCLSIKALHLSCNHT